jgi:hypothetical protein
MSGSVVLEYILCNPKSMSPNLEQLSLQELNTVSCWYIWWQGREWGKGENVASPCGSDFSIQTLAENFNMAESKSEQKEVTWAKPTLRSYKLNVDAPYHANGSGTIEAVMWNHTGEAIAGMCP